MKLLILGCGAVGGYFGGRLIQSIQRQQQASTATAAASPASGQQREDDAGDHTQNYNDVDDSSGLAEVTFLIRENRAQQIQSNNGYIQIESVEKQTIETIGPINYIITKPTASTSSASTTSSSSSKKTGTVLSSGVVKDGGDKDDGPNSPQLLFDVIVLTCKSYGLDNALDSIEEYIHSGVIILPLLNGITHIDIIQKRYPQAIIWGGTCGIVATLKQNTMGTIQHITSSPFVKVGKLSQQDDKDATATRFSPDDFIHLFSQAPKDTVTAIASTNIMIDMWSKWCFLTTVASATCLYIPHNIGEIYSTTYGKVILERLLEECTNIAKAEGYFDDNKFEFITPLVFNSKSKIRSSMSRDLEQQQAGGSNKTEYEHIIGEMINLGCKHQISTPTLELVYTKLQLASSSIN